MPILPLRQGTHANLPGSQTHNCFVIYIVGKQYSNTGATGPTFGIEIFAGTNMTHLFQHVVFTPIPRGLRVLIARAGYDYQPTGS